MTSVALPWTLCFVYSFFQHGHDADSEFPRRSEEGTKLKRLAVDRGWKR